jgi:hypothetical protein
MRVALVFVSAVSEYIEVSARLREGLSEVFEVGNRWDRHAGNWACRGEDEVDLARSWRSECLLRREM